MDNAAKPEAAESPGARAGKLENEAEALEAQAAKLRKQAEKLKSGKKSKKPDNTEDE